MPLAESADVQAATGRRIARLALPALGVLAAESPKLRRFGISLDYERYFNSNNYSADILETGLDYRF